MSKPAAKKSSKYVPAALRRGVEGRDGPVCVYCEKRGLMELDHVIPRSQRGRTVATNLVQACRSCNHIKADWPLALFAQRLEAYGKGKVKAATILARVHAQLAAPLPKE